jgi:membrane protease YdiL (CAAX protease family)
LAAVVSALIFGAMHGNLVVAIEAFCVGIVLSYLYILKGSLFAPILLHIMNNVVAYVMMSFKYQERTIEDFIGELPIFSVIYVVASVIVLLGAIHIGYVFRKANKIVANGGELIELSGADK